MGKRENGALAFGTQYQQERLHFYLRYIMDSRTLTDACIKRYAAHLREEERTAATTNKYVHDARAFLAWLQGRAVTREAAAQWKAHLLSRGCAPATVNAKLSAINGLFRFLGWDECQVKFLKLQRRTFRDASRDLSRQEYDRLLSAASGYVELLLQTISSTGIRVSEVRYITVEARLTLMSLTFLWRTSPTPATARSGPRCPC